MDSRLTIVVDFPERLHHHRARTANFLRTLLEIFIGACRGTLTRAELEWFDTRTTTNLKAE